MIPLRQREQSQSPQPQAALFAEQINLSQLTGISSSQSEGLEGPVGEGPSKRSLSD